MMLDNEVETDALKRGYRYGWNACLDFLMFYCYIDTDSLADFGIHKTEEGYPVLVHENVLRDLDERTYLHDFYSYLER